MVFEKSKQFFILLLDGRYREGGQGPGKGPNIYIYMYIEFKVLSIYSVLPGFREFAVFEKIKRFFILFLDGRYREGVRHTYYLLQVILRYCLKTLYSILASLKHGK